MIIVNNAVLEACNTYPAIEAAALVTATPADVLLVVCTAALKAKGSQPREWWTEHLGLHGLGSHLLASKILIHEGGGLLWCPEGADAKLVAAGSIEWFEAVWKAYEPGPELTAKSKGAKSVAIKAWNKLKPMDVKLYERILSAVKSEVESGWSGGHGKNPHVATWLNQKRWQDVEAAVVAPGSVPTGGSSPAARENRLLSKMRGALSGAKPGGA